MTVCASVLNTSVFVTVLLNTYVYTLVNTYSSIKLACMTTGPNGSVDSEDLDAH